MPLSLIHEDFPPVLSDHEIVIGNEGILVDHIADIMLGNYYHVQKILQAKTSAAISTNAIINEIISKLGKMPVEHRDGYIFQIISWIALYMENIGQEYYTQPPHDAPAQHGLDGLSIVFKKSGKIKKIIITEDKCTTNERKTIRKEVWTEFKKFEEGKYDNKLVSRITAMIVNLDSGKIFENNKNDIYKIKLRRYRVGINRGKLYNTSSKRERLFKGYDTCVAGTDQTRRTSATLFHENIRSWMEDITALVIANLKSKLV